MGELESTAILLLSLLTVAVIIITFAEELFGLVRNILKRMENSAQTASVNKNKPPANIPAKKEKIEPQLSRNARLCTNCGYKGVPKIMTKGYLILEIIIWGIFLLNCFLIFTVVFSFIGIPGMLIFGAIGIIYSVWRHLSRFKACPECQNANMIPLNSPMAENFLKV